MQFVSVHRKPDSDLRQLRGLIFPAQRVVPRLWRFFAIFFIISLHNQNVPMKNTAEILALRAQFGRNLRVLTNAYASISETSRKLGINRAQYNRYLNGESYPRPDVLQRICEFFGTDARILTEPLDAIRQKPVDVLSHPEIRDYALPDDPYISEDLFPSGLYRFSRPSFLYPEKFVFVLLLVYRRDGLTFIKGAEPRQSIRDQGLPDDPRLRRFKGYMLPLENGVGAIITRRNAMTCTFNFLTPVPSFNDNFWQGYAARTVHETIGTRRAVRMACEYLGHSTSEILQTARFDGFCTEADLPAFHHRLLRIDEPFS